MNLQGSLQVVLSVTLSGQEKSVVAVLFAQPRASHSAAFD